MSGADRELRVVRLGKGAPPQVVAREADDGEHIFVFAYDPDPASVRSRKVLTGAL